MRDIQRVSAPGNRPQPTRVRTPCAAGVFGVRFQRTSVSSVLSVAQSCVRWNHADLWRVAPTRSVANLDAPISVRRAQIHHRPDFG